MSSQTPKPQLPVSDFFNRFAAVYVRQTGHATLDILSDVITDKIQTSSHPIGPDSVVHDTAAGPGIGAAAIIASLPKEQLPKHVLVTDHTPMMVTAAKDSLAQSPLPDADVREMDSHDLKGVEDEHFTHSINNFSIFTFARPVDAVRETYRTLRPDGLAVVTCWSRFPLVLIVRAAQATIRTDLPPMPTAGPEFLEEGVLERTVEDAGFDRSKMSLSRKTLVVSDSENLKGLTELMKGPLMSKAREGYSEEEEARWAGAVDEAIQAEVEGFGGIRFDAYILLATK